MSNKWTATKEVGQETSQYEEQLDSWRETLPGDAWPSQEGVPKETEHLSSAWSWDVEILHDALSTNVCASGFRTQNLHAESSSNGCAE